MADAELLLNLSTKGADMCKFYVLFNTVWITTMRYFIIYNKKKQGEYLVSSYIV